MALTLEQLNAASPDARATAAASVASSGPHNTTLRIPVCSRRRRATAPNRSADQRLFGQAAPGFISTNGSSAPARSTSRVHATTGVAGIRSGNRRARVCRPSSDNSDRFLSMTCPAPSPPVCE